MGRLIETLKGLVGNEPAKGTLREDLATLERQLSAEARADRLASRRQLVEDRAVLLRDHAKAQLAQQAALTEAEARLQAATAALRAAEQERNVRWLDKQGAELAYSRGLQIIDEELRHGADPRLAALAEELDTACERTRQVHIDTRTFKNWLTDEERVVSGGPEHAAALSHLRAARLAAAALALEALDEAALAAALAELRRPLAEGLA